MIHIDAFGFDCRATLMQKSVSFQVTIENSTLTDSDSLIFNADEASFDFNMTNGSYVGKVITFK
jgi:hypothetical protein